MSERKYSYDPACEELARHFLNDGTEDGDENRIKELAQHIQQEIEDWLYDGDPSHSSYDSGEPKP